MDKDEASQFLASLLNKYLRVRTTDGRMFWGQFKCTDPDRNIILAHTYEYREPSPRERAKQAENAAAVGSASVAMELSSRYLGLVVVPGEHIVKIELEQFTSQMKKS
ncbi:hypothetical protein NKR23_g11987 [Pleurostoma richardsiae]|uniref:Sm domain-containing protein n=1 Tax=Pleurostoma richardsiae TaxID=41990 RepID=A0AA38RHP9_9PEZI|nr:hypothetical protein NKR23_g11987 [Pleurostoma richardsiae]